MVFHEKRSGFLAVFTNRLPSGTVDISSVQCYAVQRFSIKYGQVPGVSSGIIGKQVKILYGPAAVKQEWLFISTVPAGHGKGKAVLMAKSEDLPGCRESSLLRAMTAGNAESLLFVLSFFWCLCFVTEVFFLQCGTHRIIRRGYL